MRYWEDIDLNVPAETRSRTVSEAEIIAYARQFDPQPFHVDPERARAGFYGGIIASGWHTAALAMRLMVEDIINDTAGLGSPGFDDLRWLKPVRPGDTIRVRVTCIEKTPSRSRPTLGSARFLTEVLNQKDEVVLTMVNIGLTARRPTTD